ncbi:hypothetical protein BDN71DRAFT_1514544 [Pleurotus eryngii]|uniref:Uncharacterized protein n=1 Tax=Pleurotus eryngii TaxID=5323 RepID=A0A9P6D8J3_PLEER|nr:hypothetical protein BDN71DRAFT_1514544 [Pleurotus eryngii]
MLRRAQEERQKWLPAGQGAEAPEHDNLEEQEVEEVLLCGDHLCSMWCGDCLAQFAKAEGVAKILQFLEDIHADPNSSPSYIAIDKGCALLKHIVKQGHWPAWEPTTWIIVDSYHYITHWFTDHLFQT